MVTDPAELAIRNTYYWDRKAMQMYPRDYSKAQVYHWLETIAQMSTRYLQFIGRPLENRIWFEYPAQTSPRFVNPGTVGRPTKIGRVVEDGTTSLTLIEYSPAYLPERVVDPCGRETVLVYDQADPPQLRRVEQKTAAGSDTTLLLEYDAGFPRHASHMTDGGGGVMTISYNSFAQPTRIVDALGQETELGYDPAGFLRTITRFLGGIPAVTEIAHETIGGRLSNRIESVTGPDGQVASFEYDELDRVTTTTYPNGSVERAEYDRLDLASYTDQMGNVTVLVHDSERRLRKITRPLEGDTTVDWCACGCPEQFKDARNQKTYLRYDLQGRLISRASNDHWAEEFEYERTTGRVAFHRDARGLVTAFRYYADDRLRSIRYLTSPAGDTIPPGSVDLRYDPAHPRLAEMTDESGTTTYEYGPMTPASAGAAGRVSRLSRTSPSGQGTVIDYHYDPGGRPTGRTVTDLAGATVSQFTAEYDELGRVARKSNSLGQFTIEYLDMGCG